MSRREAQIGNDLITWTNRIGKFIDGLTYTLKNENPRTGGPILVPINNDEETEETREATLDELKAMSEETCQIGLKVKSMVGNFLNVADGQMIQSGLTIFNSNLGMVQGRLNLFGNLANHVIAENKKVVTKEGLATVGDYVISGLPDVPIFNPVDKHYWEVMRAANNMNDQIDVASWMLKDQNSDTGKPLNWPIDKIKQKADQQLWNASKCYYPKVVNLLNGCTEEGLAIFGESFSSIQNDIDSMKAVCGYIRPRIASAKTRDTLFARGEWIDQNVPKLTLVRRSWCLGL